VQFVAPSAPIRRLSMRTATMITATRSVRERVWQGRGVTMREPCTAQIAPPACGVSVCAPHMIQSPSCTVPPEKSISTKVSSNIHTSDEVEAWAIERKISGGGEGGGEGGGGVGGGTGGGDGGGEGGGDGGGDGGGKGGGDGG
jgi:hypothetical protein